MNLLLRITCIFGLAVSAMAVDLTFTGAVSSDWNTVGNWKVTSTNAPASALPDGTSAVIIGAGKTVSVTDPGGLGENTIDLEAKSLNVAGTLDLRTGTGNCTLNVQQGIVLGGGSINLGSTTATATTGLRVFLNMQNSSSSISGSGVVTFGLADNANQNVLQIAAGGTCTIGSGVIMKGGLARFEKFDVNSVAPTTLVISSGATLELTSGGAFTADGVNITNQGTVKLANTSTLAIPNANFTQVSTGFLNVKIGDNAQIFVDQASAFLLDGTLIADLETGFDPGPEETFTICSNVTSGTMTLQNASNLLTGPTSDTGPLVVTYKGKRQSVLFPALSSAILVNGANVPLLASSTQNPTVTYSIALVERVNGATTTTAGAATSTLVGNALRPGSVAETIRITAKAGVFTDSLTGDIFAADTSSQDVVIHQPQVITASSAPATPKTGDTFTLTATPSVATWLGSSVVATWNASPNIAVATVDPAGLVTITGPGTVTLTATTPAVAPYLVAATKTVTFTAFSPQTVTITSPVSPLNLVLTASPQTVTATFETAPLATGTWTSSVPAVATVNNVTFVGGTTTVTVTPVGAGTTNIVFTAPGNATFLSGTATLVVTVGLAPQTITIMSPSSPATVPFSTTPTTVTARHNPSSATGVWSSSNTAVATIASASDSDTGGIATARINHVGVGSATITFTVPADATFQSASGGLALTISKGAQGVAITSPASPLSIPFAATLTRLTATHQGSSVLGTWSSSNTAVATVTKLTDASGTTTADLACVGLGTATITFSALADANLNAGSATLAFTVTQNTTPLASTISFPTLSSTINFGGPDVVMAATSNKGLVVNYGISLLDSFDRSTLSSTLSGATFSILRPGLKAETLRVTAVSTAGTSPIDGLLYASASTTQDVVIHQPQVITISGVPAVFKIGDTYNLVATLSVPKFNSVTVPVTWSSSSNTSVATINAAGALTVVGNGTTTLTVGSPSVGTYLAQGDASVTINTTPVVAKPESDSASSGGGGCSNGSGIAALLGSLALALRSVQVLRRR